MPKYKRSAPRYKATPYPRKEPVIKLEPSIKICSNDHQQISYFGTECPFCARIELLERKIAGLENSYESLADEFEEMEGDLEFYRRKAGL